MKDSANSYEQKAWEHYVAEYARMQDWLQKTENPRMREYAQARIDAIERLYPSIKED